MTKIRFTGWMKGMNKIEFIKLLNAKGGLTLNEAKKVKEIIVDGGQAEIVVNDVIVAGEIVKQATSYGVKCEVVE